MSLYDDAQQRIEEAMDTVFGIENEEVTYADATVGENLFVMVQTDDDTIYIDIGFDDPPATLPATPEEHDPVLGELVQMLERAYLRVQQRRTSFDFELRGDRRPTYRVTRPLVIDE